MELETISLFPNTLESEKTENQRKHDEFVEFDSYAAAYWRKCKEIIKDNVSAQVYKTWFEPIKAINWLDNQLTVKVPSQFFCEWIEEHYYPLLQKTIKEVLGQDAKLQYQVVVDESLSSIESTTIKMPAFKYPPSATNVNLPFAPQTSVKDNFPNFLNARYSFDNFIRGESNQLAFSAAMAVAQNPGGTRYNPLFVYGDTGLGKTHLVQGIGNFILHNNPRARVLYTTSERFTIEFTNAILNDKINEFIAFYRSIDVLIIDDIQFFAGKEKTQDNFFHTFNALHQAGKQIIMTSDKPHKDIADVDERLISRFQWGLTVDIQAPDYEMRMALLQRKSLDEGCELPLDVTDYIAKNVKSSVRELEGTLISLLAKVALDKRELNLDLAKEVVNGMTSCSTNDNDKPLTMEDIKEAVSAHFNVDIELIESKSRKHEIALARQMAIYLAKQLTSLSLKNIGANFGGRDHSTVLHSCQAIENYLVTDKSVKNAYENLLSNLKK